MPPTEPHCHSWDPLKSVDFWSSNQLLFGLYLVIKFQDTVLFYIFSIFFLAFDFLSVLLGHSFFSSPPQRPMTFDFEGFSIPDFIHYIYLNSWERASIFPFECSVLNKGTTGTIFITALVWSGPWLGIEPEPSALDASRIPLGYRGGDGHIM